MATLVYTGPGDGYDAPTLGIQIHRGVPFETTEKIAKELLKRDDGFEDASDQKDAATVAGVLEWVGQDAGKAAEALSTEKARGRDARKSLVTQLEAVIAAAEQSEEG